MLAPGAADIDVLILVVVEDVLVPVSMTLDPDHVGVLILVVVEDVLVHSKH